MLDTSSGAQGSVPLVTALINTYNYARYLPFAINSVLQQTYPNIEIIVVDDGSKDHTPEVLAQYRDRIRTIRTENGGQAHAFNVGISQARGELLMLLDADDVWLPNKVERIVELAAKRPNASMLYHHFQNVDQHGNRSGPPQPYPLIDGDYRAKYLRSGGTLWHPITSVLTFRPDHIRRALPIPEYPHREGADALLTDFSAMTTEIASVSEVLTMRLLHGSNLYASGRNRLYRSKAVRESDIRRIEWRMFSMNLVMKRNGMDFDLNLKRNEWLITNLYWLGRAPVWRILWACLLNPEHSMNFRLGRLRWILATKRACDEVDSGARSVLDPMNDLW